MKVTPLAIVAGAGFLGTLAIHVTTYFGLAPYHEFPLLWLLNLGIFVVWIPLVLELSEAGKNRGLGRLLRRYPAWAISLAIVIHAAAVVAGLAAVGELQGSPEARPSGYVLVNHGRFIRELSEDEYWHLQAINSRFTSAVGLSFYGVATVFFGCRSRKHEWDA